MRATNWIRGVSNLSLYDALLAVALAAGWLLPNHYPPWSAFHSNAWVACILVLVALRVTRTVRVPIQISATGIFLALLALIPWVQHAAGILPLRSSATMGFLYLLGFAAAFILGEHWNRARPGRPVTLILVAASMAAAGSVGLAIYQWLGLTQDHGLTDIWVLHLGDESRPYANLGQPNQLASLLLWGLLGVGWIWHKRWIGIIGGILLAVFILFGIALTESRTALLTLTLGTTLVSIRKWKFLDRNIVRGAQGLYVYYLACLFGHAQLGHLIGLDTSLTMLTRSSGELRFALWRMAFDASIVSPWFGFGWGRANEGFFQVFLNYPIFADLYFEQSHNLPLDLVLWFGWPLGLGLSLGGALWLWRVIRSISNTEQLLLVASLGVMLVHAMLEFPLHYGYFLWPFGVLAGSAATGTRAKAVVMLPQKVALAVAVAFLAVLAVVVQDYLKVEASFSELRFQISHIGRDHNETPPKTVILTDWPKVIALARATPHSGMSTSEIREWEALLSYNASPLAFRKVIGAMMLNGRPDEAKIWAARSCWLLPQKACKTLINEWKVPMQPPTSLSGSRED